LIPQEHIAGPLLKEICKISVRHVLLDTWDVETRMVGEIVGKYCIYEHVNASPQPNSSTTILDEERGIHGDKRLQRSI
jgi:hypothetical protein